MRNATFAGFLGRDAELRYIPSGDAVAGFSLAISKGTKDKPATLWVDCTLWGKRAEGLSPYLLKGTPVTVCGDVDIEQYTTKAGDAGAKMTCRVDKLTFGGNAGGGNGETIAPAQPAARPSAPAAPARSAYTEAKNRGSGEPAPAFDDDIPFNRIGDFQQ